MARIHVQRKCLKGGRRVSEIQAAEYNKPDWRNERTLVRAVEHGGLSVPAD